MKKGWIFAILGVFSTLDFIHDACAQDLSITDKDARAAHKIIKAQKIILVGDSTTQSNSGWGGWFCAKHVVSSVSCINLARGGRSSFSYRAEGSWDIALSEMEKKEYSKTYVLIQFGHNDMPGKPGRSTELETEFPNLISRYVQEVRGKGAIPVLLTPLTRRSFKDGKLKNDLLPWSEKIREISTSLNVPLVDLNQLSAKAVQELGPLESMKFAQMPPTSEIIEAAKTGTTKDAPKANFKNVSNCTQAPSTINCVTKSETSNVPTGKVNLSFDYTHLGDEGAKFFSGMVANALAASVPELSDYLLQ